MWAHNLYFRYCFKTFYTYNMSVNIQYRNSKSNQSCNGSETVDTAYNRTHKNKDKNTAVKLLLSKH